MPGITGPTNDFSRFLDPASPMSPMNQNPMMMSSSPLPPSAYQQQTFPPYQDIFASPQSSPTHPNFLGSHLSPTSGGSMTSPPGAPQAPSLFKPFDQHMEIVDRMIERFLIQDCNFPSLIDRMRITCESGVTVSGIYENDYPNPMDSPVQVKVNQLKVNNKVPIPQEILEQVGNVTQTTLMGLFPEISRAWLTLESAIYMWNFETGGDVAFYDALGDVICSVGLIKPKPGVFREPISHLLVLTTPNDIVALGVILAPTTDNKSDELQLTPDVIYSVPTDGVPITVVHSTDKGRIFLGGQDGNLYELAYQKEIGWWGKRCKKVNHTKSPLSFLVPAFVSGAFSNSDPITEIVVDNSRNILYTLTSCGTIEAFDLGMDGTGGPSRVASFYNNSLVNFNRNFILRGADINNQLTGNDMSGIGGQPEGIPEISPVIHLLPLTESDSPHLGLVGFTKECVRLYFSTGSPPPYRPSTLRLLHVRYPPPSLRPAPFPSDSLTSATHKFGSYIVATTNPTVVQDKVWCFSSDFYPLRPGFSEEWQFHNLNAPVLAIGELKTNAKSVAPGGSSNILVQQQNINPNRFVLITPQGTEVYEKLRPVDILAEILRERHGPDCEEVKQYILEQGTDQGCAMALILACSFLTTQAELAEWATRAFFLYGGDPKEMAPSLQSMSLSHYGLPPGFRPTQMSSPLNDKQLPRISPNMSVPGMSIVPDVFSIQMSSKHNGLYLYLSRILRPVWTQKVVNVTRSSQTDEEFYFSNIHEDDVCRLASRLHSLKAFLDKNTAGSSDPFGESSNRETILDKTAQSVPGHSLRLQEKTSLDALRFLVEHATQVFGLWKILCQHQFPCIVSTLRPEHKMQLSMACFRDIILCGKDICSALINKLINLYLNDNAPVDSISAKLREVCPTLYKSEDATCSKVNEILISVKDVKDEERKMVMLRLAIKLCKEVVPHMNHSSVCKQLVNHRYYDGVIEVCRDAANKSDPHDLASAFVAKNQRPTEDQAGSAAYFNRCNAYKDLAAMLDDLFIKCQLGNNSVYFDGSSPEEKNLEEVINKCLALEDEAAHMVVYDWMVTRNLQASLVKFGRPSLERYLLLRYPPESALRDLLWQYHERAGNHARAAQILYKLATSRGESIKLHQRLTYLGKAVMCMRSDSVGCAPNLGVFLHELEDLVLVARVQKQVLDKVSGMVNTHALAEEAIKKLNSNLLSITELYEDFAEPFDLWECKLTILDCAGHDEPEVIKNIWNEVIKEELDRCTSYSPDEQLMVVMSKVKSLGLQYTPQSPCFPLYYLVWQLELLACRLNVNKGHVHSTMENIGVSVSTLLDIYNKMFSENDRCWHEEGNELHLIQTIASFADYFIANPAMVFASDRKSIAVQMRDLITNCLSTLYSKPDYQQLKTYLKTIQSNLDRI